MAFGGFGAGIERFFAELEDHNDRDWWQANKGRHAEIVGGPMKALAAELEPEFGPVKIFRPYRDVRFSADKRPLQEHASMATVAEGPVLYLQVSADGLMLAGGYYQPARPQLDAFRALLDSPRSAAAIHRRLDALATEGYAVHGMTLTRAPRGYRVDHPEIDLLRLTSLAVGATRQPGPWLATPEVLGRVVEGWRAVGTWNAWLADHIPPPR